MAVALSESVDSSPHGQYICFIGCKVITIFLFGLPHEAIDTVANCYLYSTNLREREREIIRIRIFIELGHLPVSMGKGGGYRYIHPGRHTCAFHTAEFNDLLNTKTRKRNHQNIPYMVSAWFLHVS